MEKAEATMKIIELRNGFVEVIKPSSQSISTAELYKFLAKLLVEDKKMQKNES